MRKMILVLVLFSVLLLTGCTDSGEVDEVIDYNSIENPSIPDGILQTYNYDNIQYDAGVKTNALTTEGSVVTYTTGTIWENSNTEEYGEYPENRFIGMIDSPVSTFSADVDTAAYSNLRRYIYDGYVPPVDSVRIEEYVNYFNYELNDPENGEIFGITTEVHETPWNSEHDLLMIGLSTEEIEYEQDSSNNLVFLIDVSGSMSSDNKLPLVKESLAILVEQLDSDDTVSIVVYAGNTRVVLDGGTSADKEEIMTAINSLGSGGSTSGSSGIELAYDTASKHFIEGENNRIILCTDGDFNLGIRDVEELKTFISEKRETGVYLSVMGFGIGNTKHNIMETLASNGNGVFYYVDGIKEAQKIFGTELNETMFTVAKDVKFQIEFNPQHVKGYRLIGYENRVLNYEDFENNEVDAGDIGNGHEVIVYYEIIRAGSLEVIDPMEFEVIDDLKYDGSNYSNELATLKINYKDVDTDIDKHQNTVIEVGYANTMSETYAFSSAVVEVGLLLRESEFKYDSNYTNAFNRGLDSLGTDPYGYRVEFLQMVEKLIEVSEIEE